MKLFAQVFTFAILIATPLVSNAQLLFSKNAAVYFDATTPTSPEKIEAKHNSGTLVLDVASGKVEAAVLLQGFLFEKALMQEHFNENYVESGKYPKATFKGNLEDHTKFNINADGVYKMKVKGDFTMHGVTKPVTVDVKISVVKGVATAAADFSLTFADYGIKIPSLVGDKVAKVAKINFKGELQKRK